MFLSFRKRSNALLEYIFLIGIIVFAVSGIAKVMERHIKAYVKNVNDSTLRKPIGFLWQGSLSVSTQDQYNERIETFEGDTQETGALSASHTSIQFPTPPHVLVAGLHVQDPPDPGGEGGQRRRNPIGRRFRENYES